MKTLANLITPNKSINTNTTLMLVVIWFIGTIVIWSFSGHQLFPTPHEILVAIKRLVMEQGFVGHLLTSTILCFKAILYSVLFSLIFAILSVLPIFRPLTNTVGKARFLSTVGLTFMFAAITPDTNTMKVYLLVFAIFIFMVTSFLGIIYETSREEIDYARTLKLSPWQIVWEVMIKGKADQYLVAIKQNFAVAWMMLAVVENLCRAEGGIGVILYEQNKQFHLDAVYAIQLIVLFVGIGLDWFLGFLREIFCPYSVLTLNKK
jgi:ABC-type nitrate/sulfonate/bicarbonate transport system permease component